ncbi:MAG TPA: response regulator transcription factor, partial [Solirubrobacteraceae bacterium]|nr:response regulator transcription factor [Solirubrobacteraceae bacterium]
MTDDRLRVLIADDHPLFRQGLRVLVESADDLAVVGEAQNGTGAVAQTLRTRPDVVLMDLNMPALGGVEATRRIVAAHPQIRVLILTMFEEDESVFAAMRAGARGYLLKGSGRNEVLRAVRTVAAGRGDLRAAIAERLT